MKIEKIEVGYLDTNCYLLKIDDECVVVDPGGDFIKIKKAIGKSKVVGVLVTHFHQDHIEALEEVLSYYDAELNKVNSDKYKYEVIETPGHTNDSRTYYFKKINTMFTGDFIFNSSIGRTDLGGSDKDMQESLEMIKKYPDNTILYPGHGPETILGKEKSLFSLYY
jgi:glyoxylase-like metal-dependent hydrolase (beta-lactamase superfamily II)